MERVLTRSRQYRENEPMALTPENPEFDALDAEQADLTDDSKAKAVSGKQSLEQFLETHIWPAIPKKVLGNPVSNTELEDILAFGPGGV